MGFIVLIFFSDIKVACPQQTLKIGRLFGDNHEIIENKTCIKSVQIGKALSQFLIPIPESLVVGPFLSSA